MVQVNLFSIRMRGDGDAVQEPAAAPVAAAPAGAAPAGAAAQVTTVAVKPEKPTEKGFFAKVFDGVTGFFSKIWAGIKNIVCCCGLFSKKAEEKKDEPATPAPVVK